MIHLLKRYSKLHRLNQLQTAMIMLSLLLLLAAILVLLGGAGLLIEVGAYIFIVVVVAPYLSPKVVLKLFNARPVELDAESLLSRQLFELSEKAGIKQPPQVYYIASPKVIAFTVGGKRRATIALSDGLLRLLNPWELKAVLAHEVAHIKHGDVTVMAVADFVFYMVYALSILGGIGLIVALPFALFTGFSIPWLLFLVLMAAPVLTILMRMKLSRIRELEADRCAALLHDPWALISALNKLDYRLPGWLEYFVIRKPDTTPSLLRTHPETELRVAQLEAVAIEMGIRRPMFNFPNIMTPRHLRELRDWF